MNESIIYTFIKWSVRFVLFFFSLIFIILLLTKWINPPITTVILSESISLDQKVNQEWRTIDKIGKNVILTVLASEDSNFCTHYGFDFNEIFRAKEKGFSRGASTISQQVSKNLILWRERSWFRKGLEALITIMIETLWSKKRILEIYLNIAETGNGYFGIQAISNSLFKKNSYDLTLKEASYIAVTLPNPKKRNAKKLSINLKKRAESVRNGANTLRLDGRASCVL
ncbi:MAG: monofunctional biosynthetic peptidoglycan transglycosylase [Rhodobacterales bacterium]|nr:MAG: monofunctional biosynthetic peptidoglycan transglycosylase [Rhodobacterales bacterium]|tara:strand:- start:438 stop:1118 length:681 start_codon:yes stop_codon:yes gene_type:complete